LAPGTHLSRQDAWIFGAKIAAGPQQHHLLKPGGPKLIQEDHAFLGAGNS
jgi:hypothetical protein